MNNRICVLLLVLALALAGCAAPVAPAPLPSATAVPPTDAPPSATPSPTADLPATQAAQATAAALSTEAARQAVVATLAAASDEEIIEYEMRGAFDFFWEQANSETGSPGYGLVRDRFPGSEGIASMASTGFGLTALVVGVGKGYITREQGNERALGTLDTLLNMERVEGFYYHFVDMKTGDRAWSSEVSSIDTSILLMGVLAAGEYFGGEAADKAAAIYEGVNWPWFVDPERSMFYMAYRPEKGFEGHWDFYAEQLMMYVLAAGSPTHPTGPEPYYTFTRHSARFGEGQPFIHSWFGSIFTYQFSHAWIDFRGYTDREGASWYDNSVEASLAHYNFASVMERKYKTLGPHAWGLTACDGPDGYNGLYGAPPSGFDNRAHKVDDTIPPAGAIGSIIFLPEQSLQAMHNYYTIEALKGRYGFMDAYNLEQDWYASDVIGIDKGISLLMLANHQGDLVYASTMDNPAIQAGLERLEITRK